MTCYLDTSLLVPLFIREPGTARAQAFLTANAAQVLLISPWTITEFSSALARPLSPCLKSSAASGAALRAGDALHLAVGRRLRGSLSTMDKGLAAAGQEVGLAVELIQA